MKENILKIRARTFNIFCSILFSKNYWKFKYTSGERRSSCIFKIHFLKQNSLWLKLFPALKSWHRSMTDALKLKRNSDCDKVNKTLKASPLLITLQLAYRITEVLPIIFWKHFNSTNAHVWDNLLWHALPKTVRGYAQLCQGSQLD
jgi:hypothetical protein